MNLDKNQEMLFYWVFFTIYSWNIFWLGRCPCPWIPEHWKDDALLAELKKKNEEKIAALDKKIADAEELEGMTHAYYSTLTICWYDLYHMIYTVCSLHIEIEMIQVTKMSEMQQLIKLIIWLKLVTKMNQLKSLELVSLTRHHSNHRCWLELILSFWSGFRSHWLYVSNSFWYKMFFLVFQEDKKVPLGVKLDVTFSLLRIGLFYNDRTLIVENVKKARKMIDDGGDWDRRNRLKVYEGLYKLTIRDFKWVIIYDTRGCHNGCDRAYSLSRIGHVFGYSHRLEKEPIYFAPFK